MKNRRFKIGTIPTLLFFQEDIETAGSKGTILFYHGLTVSKDSNEKELKSLASLGFLAVGIDNVGHGERFDSEYQKLFQGEDLKNNREVFLDSIVETAAEVPLIIDFLIQKFNINEKKIGICGISMGGHIAYRALVNDMRIKTATPIIASPSWANSSSPDNFLETFYPRAILSQTAADDDVVPPKSTKNFHQKLSVHYKSCPDKLKYIEFPNCGHFLPEQVWSKLWKNVLDWFVSYI